MNTQFILNYQGTKFKETSEIDHIDFDNYETIIEPFGGSFGFSRYLWEIKNMKDKKYIILDNNKELIDFYNFLKETDIEKFLNDYANINTTLLEKFKHGNDKTMVIKKPTLEYIKKNIECPHMRFVLQTNIDNRFVSRVCNKENSKFYDMIKETTFIHSTFQDYDLSKYNPQTTLIYFDPPYLGENNVWYSDIKLADKMYEKMITTFNNNYCLFVHSYNFFINYVFDDYKYYEYDKKYGNTRRIVKHVVYYNN